MVAGPSNTKKCDLCDRRTTRPTSKVAPATHMLDHRQGQRMLESCEMCRKGAIGPTNLGRHMHQEVVLPSYGGALEAICRVEPSANVSIFTAQ